MSLNRTVLPCRRVLEPTVRRQGEETSHFKAALRGGDYEPPHAQALGRPLFSKLLA